MSADRPGTGTETAPAISPEFQAEIRRLYDEYTNTFKPLLAAVEVQQLELPSAILNEIRYFTDHIGRCYWPDATKALVADNLRMAQGHLKRACLDCMKHSILHLHVECVENFDKRYRFVDLNAVADGAFNAEYHALIKDARRLSAGLILHGRTRTHTDQSGRPCESVSIRGWPNPAARARA